MVSYLFGRLILARWLTDFLRRPGHDLKETPRKLLSFDDDSEGVKFGVFLWLVCFAIVYAVSWLIKKKGVKGSIIRAKTLGRTVMNIQHGGKTRVV